MKILEIIVSPVGATQIETRGFSGDACRAASRAIETALGAKTSDQPTAEYHAASSQATSETRAEE